MGHLASVRVNLLRPGARLPSRATAAASGFDIHACLDRASVVLSQVPTLVPTGLALEVPAGFDAQLRPRSGLARLGVLSTYGKDTTLWVITPQGEVPVADYTPLYQRYAQPASLERLYVAPERAQEARAVLGLSRDV